MLKSRGFTLVELMIVVAVIGILAAIAYPNYQNYMIRGRIPDATSALAQKRLLMEQYFQDNRTYVGASMCPASTAPDTTTSKYFKFYCSPVATANSYTLVAEGVGSMTGFGFTVDQSNSKSTSIDTTKISGWNGGNCWVTSSSGC